MQFLRPRWAGLYAARKRQKDAATSLPDLPNTLFGWMPVVWRITDQQVLASAGLDAYVVYNFRLQTIAFADLPSVLAFLQDGHQILNHNNLLRFGRHQAGRERHEGMRDRSGDA